MRSPWLRERGSWTNSGIREGMAERATLYSEAWLFLRAPCATGSGREGLLRPAEGEFKQEGLRSLDA